MDSGGLPLLSIEDADCKLPLNLPDEVFDQDTRSPPTPQPLGVLTRTSVQIALMQSFPLRLQIARLVNDFRRECPYGKAVELSSHLTSIYQSYILRFQSSVTSDNKFESFSFSARLLELLTLRFLLALHQPYIMKTKDDPTLYFSRKVSLDVSFCLLTRVLVSDDSNQGESDYHRLAITGSGMFLNAPSQAAITACEDLLGRLEEGEFPIMSVFSSVSQSILQSVIEEYHSLLGERLRTNENNVRGYLLFAGLLAKASALRSRQNVPENISNAMKVGLDHCYQLLKIRQDEGWAQEQGLGLFKDGQHEDQLLASDDLPKVLDSFPSEMESDETVSKFISVRYLVLKCTGLIPFTDGCGSRRL